MKLPINNLINNTGQLQELGIPKNYRKISNKDFATLKKNIQDDSEYLSIHRIEAVEHNGLYIVISGNQRLRAIKELGWKEVDVAVYPPETPPEIIRNRIVLANVSAGSWEDDIANEFEFTELEDLGVDLKVFGLDSDDEPDNQEVKVACPTCGSKVSEDKLNQ